MKYLSFETPFSLTAAVAAFGAPAVLVLMAIADSVGLLVYDVNPVVSSWLDLTLAMMLIGAVAVAVRFPPGRVQAMQPYQQFTGAARFIAVGNTALVLASFLLPFDLGEQWSVPVLLASYLFSALVVTLTVRHFFWLDTLMRLRRTSFTPRIRAAVLPGLALLALLHVWSGAEENDLTIGMVSGVFNAHPVAVLVACALIFLFFGAISNVSWIITLTRSQRWKGFGVCFVAAMSNLALFAAVSSGEEAQVALQVLLPGADYIVALTAFCSAAYFARVAFSLMLTLPSASIIDRQVSEKQSLSIMGRILTKVDDLDSLLAQVLGVVAGATRATVVWVELDADDDGEPVRARLNISEDQLHTLHRMKTLHAVAGTVRQPLYIEHLREHAALAAVAPATASFLKSLIIVPLELDGRRIGTLYVGHSSSFAFEHESVVLLAAVADTTSLAVQNHRLFASLLRRERYERELFLAREIQRKLLPKDYEVPEGFEIAGYTSPAFEVGGDYYDVVTLKNGRCCALVGDVSGKGMSAAMYTAELKGVVLAVASESDSPADLLCRINRAMYGSLERRLFITIAAVEIDSAQTTMRLARAGHNPFLMRTQNGTKFVTPRGMGVGLMPPGVFDRTLEMVEMPIAPGDVCLLYTDGINETVNSLGEEYGNERLETVLEHSSEQRADLLLGAIVRDTAEYGGGTPQQDDMTLLVVTRRATDMRQTAEALKREVEVELL